MFHKLINKTNFFLCTKAPTSAYSNCLWVGYDHMCLTVSFGCTKNVYLKCLSTTWRLKHIVHHRWDFFFACCSWKLTCVDWHFAQIGQSRLIKQNVLKWIFCIFFNISWISFLIEIKLIEFAYGFRLYRRTQQRTDYKLLIKKSSGCLAVKWPTGDDRCEKTLR